MRVHKILGIVAAFAAVALAAPSLAQDWNCAGSAEGPAGEVEVHLRVGRNATVRSGVANWSPPSTTGHQPLLVVSYDIADTRTGALAAPSGAIVIAVISLEPPPTAPRAEMELAFDAGGTVRQRWRMYEQIGRARAVGGRLPVMFTGSVPFSFQGDQFARLIERSQAVQVRAVASDGAVLAQSAFDISRSAHVPVLARAAFEQARRAAADPANSCEAVRRGGR